MNRGFAIGWRQVGAAMMIMACSGMVAPTYGIIAVPISHEFHPSRTVLMLAITVMSICSVLASPVIGALMDRTSLKRIIGLGIAALVSGYVALSFVSSFVHVLIVFGLFMAASQSMAGPISGSVLLTRWFEQRRGTALGIAISGIGAGSVIFPLVIQGLLDAMPWREALRVLALILLVGTVPALALIVNRPEDRGLRPDGAELPSASASQTVPAAALTTRQIVSDPSFWMLAMIVTTVMAGMMGSVTNIVPMARDLGVAANPAAAIVSVYAAASFVAKISFGAVGDRINTRILLVAILSVFAAGMTILGIAALGGAASGYGTLLVGAALVGLGGMVLPLQGLLVPRIFGAQVVGRTAGLLSVVTLIGLLLTPPIFGLAFDRTGSYAAIFFAFAVLALLAMLIVPKMRLTLRDGPLVAAGEAGYADMRPVVES